MDLELRGKIAVITGASVGIGKAVAQALASEGVNLALCARNEERLEKEADQIRKEYGVTVHTLACDVVNPESLHDFVTSLDETFDGVDILINNAGAGTNETIAEAPDEKWQYFWDLHVMAAVRLSRDLLPLFIRRGGGVILNNSSICAKQPLGYEPIYNTTKAALSMFSKCLATEYITHNIRVNTINPGLIMTPDWRKTAASLGEKEGITADEYLDRLAKEYTPIGRFATPAELAKFFVFMCSPHASYCVGGSYYVDGGWLRVVE